MPDVKKFYLGVRRGLYHAALILAFDVGLFGSILLSSLVCPIWFLASLPKNLHQRPGWGIALVRIGIPVRTIWLTHLNDEFQLAHAERNARRVVAACEAYRADHGRSPGNLEALVPRYLPSVPIAKHCLGPSGVFYYYPRQPLLVWQVVPPHYRKIYNFETRRWNTLD